MLQKIRKGPSGPPDVSGSGNVIAWRVDGSGDARTFAEVCAIIDASSFPMIVEVSDLDASRIVPKRSKPYDGKGSTFQSVLGGSQFSEINVEDGAILRDWQGILGGMKLVFHGTSGDSLVYSGRDPDEPGVFVVSRGATVRNMGSVPIATAPLKSGGPGLVVASFDVGNFETGASPLFAVAPSASAILEIIGGTSVGAGLPNDLIVGPASAQLFWVHDSTLPCPTPILPGFLGTQFNIALGTSSSSGPTSFRPSGVFGAISVGTMYFDTSKAPPIPIWWDGGQWVDATGVGPQ